MSTTAHVSTESQNIPRQGGHFGVQAAGLFVLAVILGAVYWKILRASERPVVGRCELLARFPRPRFQPLPCLAAARRSPSTASVGQSFRDCGRACRDRHAPDGRPGCRELPHAKLADHRHRRAHPLPPRLSGLPCGVVPSRLLVLHGSPARGRLLRHHVSAAAPRRGTGGLDARRPRCAGAPRRQRHPSGPDQPGRHRSVQRDPLAHLALRGRRGLGLSARFRSAGPWSPSSPRRCRSRSWQMPPGSW